VLIVDDDHSLSRVVAEILGDEGYAVACLANAHPTALQSEVARLEPDVVLLDGSGPTSDGESWDSAAWLRTRDRPIAAIMVTGHLTDLAEAQLGLSQRSQRAAFVGVLPKPFDLDRLVDLVARAVQESAADNPTTVV
jgi:CheY-like chemotaxis protein